MIHMMMSGNSIGKRGQGSNTSKSKRLGENKNSDQIDQCQLMIGHCFCLV